jgi:hypothetical protein
MVGLLASAALIVGIPANADASVRDCGTWGSDDSGDIGWYDNGEVTGFSIGPVIAKNVGCSTARRVARRSFNTNLNGKRRWRYGRWTCRYRQTGYESSTTRCSRGGGRVVRWASGA